MSDSALVGMPLEEVGVLAVRAAEAAGGIKPPMPIGVDLFYPSGPKVRIFNDAHVERMERQATELAKLCALSVPLVGQASAATGVLRRSRTAHEVVSLEKRREILRKKALEGYQEGIETVDWLASHFPNNEGVRAARAVLEASTSTSDSLMGMSEFCRLVAPAGGKIIREDFFVRSKDFGTYIDGRRVPFSVEEDKLLYFLVRHNGARRWPQLAAQLPGRSAEQARRRYQHISTGKAPKHPLSASFKRFRALHDATQTPLTADESQLLLAGLRLWGPTQSGYQAIHARLMPHKPPSVIRLHWEDGQRSGGQSKRRRRHSESDVSAAKVDLAPAVAVAPDASPRPSSMPPMDGPAGAEAAATPARVPSRVRLLQRDPD